MIHGVENFRTLKEINKQAKKHDRTIACLLQIKIATEDSKFGMSTQEASDILASSEFSELKHIKVVGVMGMATFTDDQEQIKKEFNQLKSSSNRSEEHTSELQSRPHLVCRLLLEKKKKIK